MTHYTHLPDPSHLPYLPCLPYLPYLPYLPTVASRRHFLNDTTALTQKPA